MSKNAFIWTGAVAISVGIVGSVTNIINHNYHWAIYDIGVLTQGILLIKFFGYDRR